jgi:hypothetical protein
MNAEQTYQLEVIKKMDELGLKEYSFDLDEVDVDQYHFDHDYLAVLEKSIAPIRNEHAHGSKMLYPMVLGTFGLTWESLIRFIPRNGDFQGIIIWMAFP